MNSLTISTALNGIAAASGLVASYFWFRSAALDMPLPPVGFAEAFKAQLPAYERAVRVTARFNRLAAAFSGLSAFFVGLGSGITLIP